MENISSIYEAHKRFKASHPLAFYSSFTQVVGRPLPPPAAATKTTVSVQTSDCLLGLVPCSTCNPVAPLVNASSQVVSSITPPVPPLLPPPPSSSLYPTPSIPVPPTPHPIFAASCRCMAAGHALEGL